MNEEPDVCCKLSTIELVICIIVSMNQHHLYHKTSFWILPFLLYMQLYMYFIWYWKWESELIFYKNSLNGQMKPLNKHGVCGRKIIKGVLVGENVDLPWADLMNILILRHEISHVGKEYCIENMFPFISSLYWIWHLM